MIPAPPAQSVAPARDRPPTVSLAERESTGDERDDVAAVLRSIAQAWTSGEPVGMAEDLEDEVAFVQAASGGRVEGRSAVVQSFRALLGDAKLVEYAESELSIQLWGTTCVATVHVESARVKGGQKRPEIGIHVYVLTRERKRWRVAWRLLLPASLP